MKSEIVTNIRINLNKKKVPKNQRSRSDCQLKGTEDFTLWQPGSKVPELLHGEITQVVCLYRYSILIPTVYLQIVVSDNKKIHQGLKPLQDICNIIAWVSWLKSLQIMELQQKILIISTIYTFLQ